MAQFEDYLERKKQNQEMEYRWDQEEKGIPMQKFEVGMDSIELIDYYQERLEKTSFSDRTKYYFENAGLMASKSKRYRNISKGGGNVEAFASVHGNHSADKRKKSANKAANAFGKAALLAEKYQKKKSKDFYELFTRREEVMRLRMEGMEQAAETKSTSDNNEIYLKSKAKISCLMILMDQLKNLKKQAALLGDQKVVEKLTKKEKSIRKELFKVQDDMRTYLPTTDQKWRTENGIENWYDDEEMRERVMDARGKAHTQNIYDEDILTQMNYKTIRSHVVKYKMNYPCNVVRLDQKGQPITLAESKKLEWNKRYQEAQEEEDQETLDRMDLEVLKRIENYDLPSLSAFANHDMNTLFRRHPAEYYEMFISAPDFINAQMQKEGAVKDAIDTNPVLKQKIELMKVMSRYLRASLMNSHIHLKSGNFTFAESSLSQAKEDDYIRKIQDGYLKLDETLAHQIEEEEKKGPKIQTLGERKAELTQLKQTNPGLTEDGYKIYRGFREENKVYEEPSYKKITEDFCRLQSERTGKNVLVGVSHSFGAMLRAVHYDKNGKPISEAEQKKKEQNDRWMNSWVEKENETPEEKQAREATQLEIIQKETKTLFAGFDFPEPKDLKKWTKKMLKEKPFALAEMLKRSLAYDKLAEFHPAVKEYRDNHPVFARKLNVAIALNQMMNDFTQSYYGVKTASQEGSEVIDAENQATFKTDFDDKSNPTGFEQQYLEGYTEQYNLLYPLMLAEKEANEQAEQHELEDLKTKAAKYKKDKKKLILDDGDGDED